MFSNYLSHCTFFTLKKKKMTQHTTNQKFLRIANENVAIQICLQSLSVKPGPVEMNTEQISWLSWS